MRLPRCPLGQLGSAIDNDRFSLAPLKAILAKLEPPVPQPEPLPPLNRAWDRASGGGGKAGSSKYQ
jgi:hypothetical protein